MQLLVRLRSLSGFLSLFAAVSLARRLPDLPAIKRLHVYGRHLLLLLERLASDEGAEGGWAAGGVVVASECELLCQRACEVCVQLHDQNIHMQRLLVLAYVVQHQRAGQAMVEDEVDHADVRSWLMEQRWARRLDVGDLIGGNVRDVANKQLGASGSKRRRDDERRLSAEQTAEDTSELQPSKRVDADSSATSPASGRTAHSAMIDFEMPGVGVSDDKTTDWQEEQTMTSAVDLRTPSLFTPAASSVPEQFTAPLPTPSPTPLPQPPSPYSSPSASINVVSSSAPRATFPPNIIDLSASAAHEVIELD